MRTVPIVNNVLKNTLNKVNLSIQDRIKSLSGLDPRSPKDP
jgi:hypothetical protein